jgi:putative membrane protein
VPGFSWTSWHGDPTLRAGLLLLVGAYLLGIGPLRRRYRLAPSVDRRQVALFFAGAALLFVALEGPLHDLSDNYLFSAHMLQHMFLTLFAPPLLLLGTPGWLLRPLIRPTLVRRLARAITGPLPALLLFNTIFILSHLPVFYQKTLEDHNVHIAEHLLFLATAVITWWPLLSPLPELPRLAYPLQLLYVFGQTFSGFLVGAFLTNSPRPLYPFYAAAPRVLGISALDDQRIGGLLMWIGGGTFLLLVFSAIFFVWAHQEREEIEVAAPPPRAPAARPKLPVVASVRATAGRSPLQDPEHLVRPTPDKSRVN